MKILIAVADFVFLISGIILIIVSLSYRKLDHPSITGGKGWMDFRFWRYKHLWNPPGYLLYILAIISLGMSVLFRFLGYI